MDVSNWINLGLLLLTAATLVFGIFQAKSARSDRIAANRSAKEAEATAVEIASATTRTAGATEQIAGSGNRSATALERIAEPHQPWTLTRIHPRGHAWMLRNESNRTLHTAKIATVDPDEQHYLVAEQVDLLSPEVWSPNESEILTFEGGGLNDPAYLRFVIEYTVDGDETPFRWKGLMT